MKVDQFKEFGSITMSLKSDLAESQKSTKNGECTDPIFGEEVFGRQKKGCEGRNRFPSFDPNSA